MSNSGLSRTVKEQHRPAMKADYLDAKMQSHRGNLQRSARLLATQLTELERDYLHKRIEEGAEVARLELEQAAKAAQVKKSRYRPQSNGFLGQYLPPHLTSGLPPAA
jgi:hypothetical protein